MELKLETLRLLLELTRRGKLIWEKGQDDSWWEAKLGEEKLHVEFIYFARTGQLPPRKRGSLNADETGSDRTMARIKYIFLEDYCIGTEGFDLICEMLSLCDEPWKESRERWKAKKTQTIEQLKQMLED